MASKTQSIVFVDANIEAPLQLVKGIALNGKVLILPPDRDGVRYISAVVKAHPEVSEIYLVAHGAPGELTLGTASLSLATLPQYQGAVSSWGVAHLYLYGCQVAAGDAGAEFLAALRSLTQANIAASAHPLGQASRGGRWALDTVVGAVPARSLLTPAAIATYPGLLASDNFAGATNLTGTATGSNVGATHQTGEPIHDPTVSNLTPAFQADLNDSIWWQWTAPFTGSVNVNTAGSAIDTVLAVYTGSTVNSLTLVGRNDDVSASNSSSSVTFNASSGTTYYFAVDGVGTEQGNVTITLNTPPQITPGQNFSVSEAAINGANVGTPIAVSEPATWTIVSGNPDIDGDGNKAFAINSATGQLTVNDAGDLDFESGNNFFTLQVKASDGSFSDTESVFVQVTDAPEPPAIVSLTPNQTTLNEGSLLTLTGALFDPDADGIATLTINWGDGTPNTVVSGDDLTTDGDGNYTFSLNHTYRDNGQYAVTVAVNDGTNPAVNNAANPLLISVNNVAPTITNGDKLALTVDEDSSVTFQLSATDPSSLDVLTYTIVGNPANGTLTPPPAAPVNAQDRSRLFTYNPNADFSGTDNFQIQVKDDDGGVDVINVTVNVNALPDAPTNLLLSTDPSTIDEGQSLTLTGSFRDPDAGDTFTVTINWGDGTEPTVLDNSDLSFNSVTGTYTFTVPHEYLNDTATAITVSVQDRFGAVASTSTAIAINNLAPTITPGPNTSISIEEDSTGTITFTATDPADTDFQWFILTQGGNGTATIASGTGETQVITYTPNANFNGIDEFVVKVIDGDGGENTATVVVGVTPVNDAPTDLTATLAPTTPINEGTGVVTLTGSFIDVDNSANPILDDIHTVTIDWGDGTVDIFQDADPELAGTTTSNVTFGGASPITHKYVDEGTGTYTVTITVEDSAGESISTTKTVSVLNVAPVIVDPDGTDDGATIAAVEEDSVLTFTLKATDVGVKDILTWNVLNAPGGGAIALSPSSINGTQSFIYTPDLDFEGTDTFTIQVSDGDGGFDEIDYTVTVTGKNDPPQIVVNSFNITEGEPLTVDLGVLDAVDIETLDDSAIAFTISGAAATSFLVDGVQSTTFTRQDLIDGRVTFLYDRETTPTFTITVNDPQGATATAAGNVVEFTTVNDAPILDPNDVVFSVTEGGIAAVRAANISATDEETPAANLVFTVSNVLGGTFLVSGVAATTFTQAQINSNVVQFRHDGTETPPSYTLTVSDGDLTDTRDDLPTFVRVNDRPVIVANEFLVVEGEELLVDSGVLDATDAETDDSTLITFTIGGANAGSFFVNGVQSNVFTRQDIFDGLVTFLYTGEVTPSFSITVTDPDGGVTTQAGFIADFEPVNDAPVLDPADVPFTVTEGGSITLNSNNISATDPDTPVGNLTFTVSNVQGGKFEIGGQTVTSFTQTQINQSVVRFRQDGTETVPSYTLTVSDGELTDTRDDVANLSARNDLPVIITNDFLVVEGEALLVDSSVLDAIDEETDDSTLITFTIGGTNANSFLVDGVQSTTFTRQDIFDGRVTFLYEGEVAPTFSITVNDGDGGLVTKAGIVDFEAVNDAPVLDPTDVPFTVAEGGTVVVRAVNISATDADNPAASLVFTVSNVEGGRFEVNGVASTTFTQAQITSNAVRFRHDGTETVASYTLTVSDGELEATREDVAIVNFTNDLPTFIENTFNVVEGQELIVDPGVLDAIDAETIDDTLISFTVTGTNANSFLVNGVPGTTFTRQDILAGNVSFLYSGETRPSFSITVNDGSGGSRTVAGNVIFEAVNDAPTFFTPLTPITITENGTVTVGNTNIRATDPDSAAANLTFTVSNLLGGTFLISGVAVTSFTQAQINTNVVRFRQDGTNTAPSFTLTVSDGTAAATQDFVTNFTALNDIPQLENNQIMLTEGDAITLSNDNILVIDEAGESLPEELVYKVTQISPNAAFLIGGGVVTEFTQADIAGGLVTFEHDGSNEAPSYTLSLTDATINGKTNTLANLVGVIDFTAVNDEPTLNIVFPTVDEGATIVLNNTIFAAADEPGESTSAELVYTVDAVTKGSFQVGGAVVTTFTQADIENGLVSFVHDGSEVGPSFTVTLDDNGTPAPETVTVTVTPAFNNLNDVPLLGNNNLSVREGATVTLTAANLSATDVETDSLDLEFSFSNIQNGTFEVNGGLYVPGNRFTLLDVIQGRVRFIHDGSNNPPSYEVTVFDDLDMTMPPAPATVTFEEVNDVPVLSETNPPFTILEGEIFSLDSSNINAIDDDMPPPEELVYAVSNVVGGFFASVTNTGVAITTFNQAQINARGIVFVHNGSNTAPSYTLTVTDGRGGSDTANYTALLTPVNDAPVITTNTLTLTEGDTVQLKIGNLQATDEESGPLALTYTIENLSLNGSFLVGGSVLGVGGQFTQQDVLDGLVFFEHDANSNDAPSYTLTVTDGGALGGDELTSAPSTVAIAFTAVNDPPVLVTDGLFSIEQGATVLLNEGVLLVQDEETLNKELIVYTVDEVINGRFLVNGVAATTFTQQDIEAGRLFFEHDGSESAPTYTLTVTDNGTPAAQEITFTVDLTDQFINLNAAPVFVNNNLMIQEGETIVFTTDQLSAEDAESADLNLLFTLDGITNGFFTVTGVGTFGEGQGAATGEFTLRDVIEGRVSFTHDASNFAPTYNVTVTDDDAIPASAGPAPAVVDFEALNDDPVLLIDPVNPAFVINEGATLILDTTVIDALDEEGETPQGQLAFTVSNVQGGRFARSTATGTAITGPFTRADVVEGNIVFIHDGSNVPPSYTLTVTDGEGASASANYTATLIETNEAPAITKNQLTLKEGDAITLTTQNLAASDEESGPLDLTYTLDAVSPNGEFFVNGAAIAAGGQFTQQDVIDGLVVFKHDATSNDAPSYSFTVTDGGAGADAPITVGPSPAVIAFTPVNDLPVLAIAFPTVVEGSTIAIDTTVLSVTDEESAPIQLTYTATVTNGSFQLNGVNVTTFTQQDVIDNDVTFVHDGSTVAPTITLSLSDNGIPAPNILTQSFTPVFELQNSPPAITTNTFSPVEGAITVLTASNLAAKDREDAATQLVFSIDPGTVTGGEFLLNGAALGTATFTLAQLNGGLVSFKDDGDEVAPTYAVTVTDTDGATVTQAATVTLVPVNDNPVIQNNTFALDEGGFLTLSNTNLLTVDAETANPQLLSYTISNLVAGEFFLVGPTSLIRTTTFTQRNVELGQVVFIHNGSNTPPSFTITVADPNGGSATAAANVVFDDLNDAPVAVNDGGLGFSTSEDAPVTTPALTANDTDEENDPLTVATIAGQTVSVGGTVTLASGATVTLNANNSVAYNPAGAYDSLSLGQTKAETFTYTVSDGLLESNVATVTIVVNGLNDAPIAGDDLTPGFSTTEDTAIGLNVLANDSDIDAGDILSIAKVDTTGILGTVTINPDNTLTYNPSPALNSLKAGEVRDEVFTYTLTDSRGGTDTAQVKVSVTGLNDAPIAVADSGLGFITDEDTAFVTASVLLNDSDPDLDPLTILGIDTTATLGLVTNNGDGTFSYDPNGAFETLGPDAVATDTFTYTVSDGSGAQATTTVTITINGLAEIPDSFFDFEQYLRYRNTSAVAPPETVDVLPLAQLYDENFYLSQNRDVAVLVQTGRLASGYSHFLAFGINEGRDPSILFDEDFYLASNPDVAAAVANDTLNSGLQHFLNFGHREVDRDPSTFFDTGDYLANNPDVAAAIASGALVSAFQHYILLGANESRLPSLALYNEGFYRASNPDVAAAIANGALTDGFQHFVVSGQREGRAPSSLYNEASYLALNPDVAAAVNSGGLLSGFQHYEAFGRFEGRPVA